MCAAVVSRTSRGKSTQRTEDALQEPKSTAKPETIKKFSPNTTGRNPIQITSQPPGSTPPTSSAKLPPSSKPTVLPLTVTLTDAPAPKIVPKKGTDGPGFAILQQKEGSPNTVVGTKPGGLTGGSGVPSSGPLGVSLAETGTEGATKNTKGYDNAADLVQNLFSSDLMAEVHQYLATKLSGQDLSFATLDVVKNPGAYTAEQKTLTYMELLYTHARYESFKGEADKMRDGINNGKEIDEDFKQAIAILGSDRDVQSGYVKAVLDAFKMRFNWEQLTPYENDDPLDQINQREKKDAAMKPTLQAVVAAFDRDIVEGGLIKNALAAGKDVREILQEYNTTLGAYMSILPEQKRFDTFLGEDPGLLTGPTFQERMDKAEANYKDFFVNHVLPNAPDAGSVFKSIVKGGIDQQFGGKFRSVLPEVTLDNFAFNGPVFGNFRVDAAGLKAVANRDFNRKDGDGLKNLFRPTVEVMAKLRYPDGATAGGRAERKIDVEAHRKAFTDVVLSQVDPLIARMERGELTHQQLAAYLDNLSFTPNANTPDLFKGDVTQALRGLAMGAHLMSTMPPDPSVKAGSTAGNIGTYSFNDTAAALTVATGLAGQSLMAHGVDGLSGQDRASLERMYGGDILGGGWSEAAFQAEPQNMATEFWDKSLKTMGGTLAETLRTTSGIKGDVVNPRMFTRQDELDAVAKIVSPSAEALAASYFKDNAADAKTFSANMSTILGMVWGLTKPGGDIHTLRVNITTAVEKGINAAPPSIELSRYRQMVVNGVTTIVNALRTSWTADKNPNATWDTIGLGTMHALGGLSALLKGGSAYASKLIPHMESMLPGEPDIINQRRAALSKALGTAGKFVGNAAGFGYAPLEIYQLAKALKDGGNPVDLALMGIGTLADSVAAVQSLAGLGEALINSSWANRATAAAATAGRAAAATAPFRFFTGIVSSTVFTTASAISWIAWGGYAIWQLIKRENAYNKTKDALDSDMNRLIGTNMSFYDIKSRDTDRNGVPYQDDNAERVKTPEDWSAIRGGVESYRSSQGWDDWRIPTTAP